MNSNSIKSIKDSFYDFCDNPSRDKFRKLILENTGEDNDLDFKTDVYEHYKIAKDIIAMSNTKGGALIFGITEDKTTSSFQPIGLINLEDKTQFQTKLGQYLPEQLEYLVIDINYQESDYPKLNNKKFRVIIVIYTPKYLLFLSKKDGTDIYKKNIYIRHNSSTITAEYPHVQDIINRRLATGYSSSRELSLKEQFEELKLMYSFISKGKWVTDYNYYDDEYDDSHFKENEKYPEETYEDFVLKMIELKKQVITSVVRSIS
jgi:predicted HTH transcriptional regulator